MTWRGTTAGPARGNTKGTAMNTAPTIALAKRTEKAATKVADLLTDQGFESLDHLRYYWTHDGGMTQTAYAASVGVSPQAVSKSVKKYRDAHGIDATRKGNNATGKNGTEEQVVEDPDNVVEVAQHTRTKAGDVVALAKEVRDLAVKLHKAVEKNGPPESALFHRYIDTAAVALACVMEDEGQVVDAEGHVLVPAA